MAATRTQPTLTGPANGAVAVSRSIELFFTAMANSIEKRARRQHDCACPDLIAALDPHAYSLATFLNNGVHSCLYER